MWERAMVTVIRRAQVPRTRVATLNGAMASFDIVTLDLRRKTNWT